MAAITVIASGNMDESQNPIFMATGSTTTGNQSSPDAVTWTARTLPSAIAWTGLAYGLGLGVAIGPGVAGCATSPDGTTWTARTMPSAAAWYAVAFSGTRFVATATASTSAAYSDNGFTWTASTMTATGNWRSIAYGNGTFVAIDQASGINNLITSTSTDGITWANQTASVTSTGTWTSITFGNGKFVAVCSGGTVAAESTDGVTWTATTLPSSRNWNSVCYGPTGFVAVPSNAANTDAAFSTDGTTWVAITLPASATWVAVAYGYGRYGAVSLSSTSAASSFDGKIWTARTQASAAYVACMFFPYTWNSADTLTINNGAVVTVNTDQNKFWTTIAITNGRLVITNTATTIGGAIRFNMGRASGAGTNSITPGSGLGSITINGNWIDLATGSGVAAQSVTTPYTDYIAAVWVETAAGSGVYEMWLNTTGVYGSTNPILNNGLAAVSTGVRGKFFTQVSAGTSAVKDGPLTLTTASGVVGTRIITVTSTTNLIPGASVSGTGIATNSVVQRIISGTQFEVNLVTTGTVSGSLTSYNPYRSQLTDQIVFGDGTNGNLVPTGANIRIPNILITDLTPANVQTASGILSASIVMTNGGTLQANTCLFDESYNNFTQANSIALTNVGFSLPFLISECYQFTATNLAFALTPVRRYYTTQWLARDNRSGYALAWSFISNANIQTLKMVNNAGTGYIGGNPSVSAPGTHIALTQTSNATFNNCDFFSLNGARPLGCVALSSTQGVIDCTFTNIGAYGAQPISLLTSTGNTMTNVKHSSDMFDGVCSLPANVVFRLYNDPTTGAALLDNTTYYLKVRSFRTWNDRSQYYEGLVQSFTTQNGDKLLMVPRISAISSAANTVRFDWERKGPDATIAVYEIYRGTSPGFARSGAARLTNITAAGTVTYNDATATTGNTYYYAFRKHAFQYATITANGGASGAFTITSASNMRTALGTTGNVATGKAGSTKILFAPGYLASGVLTVGMYVGNANIPTGTTIVSIDDVNEITISAACTADIDRGPLTIGVGVGMAVFGTGVAVGAVVTDVAVNGLTITVNTANTGTVSGTLTFTHFNDSNEITVVSQGAPKTATNVLLQSNTLATTWVATTITPLAAAAVGAHDIFTGTSATLSASRLTLTSTTGNVTQSPATTIGLSYTFGVWLRADLTAAQITGRTGSITLGTTTTAFTVTDQWQFVSAVFTAVATTTAATITVTGVSGNNLYVSGAYVSLTSSATTHPPMPIATTTAAVTLNPAAQEVTSAYAASRSTTGVTGNQGVDITLAATPAGTLWSELYIGTTSSFTPSFANRIGSTLPNSASIVNLSSGASDNVFDGFTLEGKGGISGATPAIVLAQASSRNKFLNFTFNAPTWYLGQIANFSNLCDDNVFHNFDLTGIRASSGIDLFTTANNCSGQFIQNIVINRASDLLSNMQALDTELRNVTSGSNAPLGTSTNYVLGGTDGVAVTGLAQYDYMFLEMNFLNNRGALFLRFNASAKAVKPYTITGSAFFDNTGKLYFNAVDDSIEIVWPHKIYGVSGFQNRRIKAIGVDLGLSADILEALYKEYAIDTGSGYGAYKEMTPANMSAETVSASAGFFFKVRLTALYAFKYPSFTNRYEVGEVIRGASSLATATVVQDYRATATTGTVLLSGITNGPFAPGETLVRNSDAQARSPSTALVSGADQKFNYPFLTSYISGLQIPTTVDQTVLYPPYEVAVNVVLQNVVVGSRYRVEVASTNTLLYEGTAAASTITLPYVWTADLAVRVRVRKATTAPKYQAFETQGTITEQGLIVFVSQVRDTVVQ